MLLLLLLVLPCCDSVDVFVEPTVGSAVVIVVVLVVDGAGVAISVALGLGDGDDVVVELASVFAFGGLGLGTMCDDVELFTGLANVSCCSCRVGQSMKCHVIAIGSSGSQPASLVSFIRVYTSAEKLRSATPQSSHSPTTRSVSFAFDHQ